MHWVFVSTAVVDSIKFFSSDHSKSINGVPRIKEHKSIISNSGGLLDVQAQALFRQLKVREVNFCFVFTVEKRCSACFPLT